MRSACLAEIRVVFGPPGTGKTTRLLELMREQIEAGVAPERIGFLSFTNAAIDEARERLGLRRGQNRSMCTIHAFAHRNAIDTNVAPITMDHEREVLHQLFPPLNAMLTKERDTRFIHAALRWRSLALIGKSTLDVVNESPELRTEAILAFLDAREVYKREHGLVDFDEMIQRFLKEGLIPDLELLYVDEAQDMDALEWQLISHLHRHAPRLRRITFAGDDDQAIHGWKGARADILLGLARKHPTEVLAQSYRVPRSHSELAQRAIARVKDRYPKEWRPRAEEGVADITGVFPAYTESAFYLARSEYLVRSELVPKLVARGIWFSMLDSRSIVHPTYLRRIDVYQRMQRGETELRHERAGAVGIGFTELRHALEAKRPWHEVVPVAEARNGLSPIEQRNYLQLCERHGFDILADPTIEATTVHRVKGRQAKNVVLLDTLPSKAQRGLSDVAVLDEEIRVLYVGLTRALHNLHLLLPLGGVRRGFVSYREFLA
jgi:superfamily I DNA/RNA helicase